MKQIHIGIDGNEANVTKRVGSNVYAYNVLQSLHKLDQTNQYTIYLKDDPVKDMPAERQVWRYKVLKPQKLWTQWRLPLELYLNRDKPDVFYSPGHYAPRKAPMPSVVTIMDLAFLHYPNLFVKYKRGTAQLKIWTEYSIRHATKVIAISEYTKQDVVKTYQLKPSQVAVAYPGLDTQRFQPATKKAMTQMRQAYHLPEKYILYVGTIQPRKNLARLLEAFEALPPKFKQYHLVIAGQKGWLYDDFERALEASPKKEKVKLLGFVDTYYLPALYSAAACFCLVGLHEGFGMPPAEALQCGSPVVVSKNTSLPEVVGKAGILVDPYSVTSIKHGLQRALELSPAQKQQRLTLAQKHLKQFDWEASARIIVRILEDVSTKS